MKKSSLMMMVSSFVVITIIILITYNLKQKPLKNDVAAQVLVIDKNCRLQQTSCQLMLPDGGIIDFSIEPRPIPLMKQLKLNVKTESGALVDNVIVEFKGLNMDMGSNRVALQTVSVDEKNAGSQHFQGQAMLPVCSENKMHWQADIHLQTKHGQIIAPFQFYTQNKY